MFKERWELVEDDCCAAAAGKIRHDNVASLPLQLHLTFFLFPRMKMELKGHQFDSIEAVQAAMTKPLNSIPETDFQWAVGKLQSRQTKCIDAGEMYFEDY